MPPHPHLLSIRLNPSKSQGHRRLTMRGSSGGERGWQQVHHPSPANFCGSFPDAHGCGCEPMAYIRSTCRPDNILEKGLFFRSEEHTSELQSLMRISYAVFCLKKKKHN